MSLPPTCSGLLLFLPLTCCPSRPICCAGMAPLHVASFRATKSFMQGLIEAGADASLETNNKQTLGESPLKIAMASGKPANAQFLQDLKAATNAIKFAVKMKAKRQKAKSANVLNLKFEGELRLFTADLEKSFLVKLARSAHLLLGICRTSHALSNPYSPKWGPVHLGRTSASHPEWYPKYHPKCYPDGPCATISAGGGGGGRANRPFRPQRNLDATTT